MVESVRSPAVTGCQEASPPHSVPTAAGARQIPLLFSGQAPADALQLLLTSSSPAPAGSRWLHLPPGSLASAEGRLLPPGSLALAGAPNLPPPGVLAPADADGNQVFHTEHFCSFCPCWRRCWSSCCWCGILQKESGRTRPLPSSHCSRIRIIRSCPGRPIVKRVLLPRTTGTEI